MKASRLEEQGIVRFGESTFLTLRFEAYQGSYSTQFRAKGASGRLSKSCNSVASDRVNG